MERIILLFFPLTFFDLCGEKNGKLGGGRKSGVGRRANGVTFNVL